MKITLTEKYYSLEKCVLKPCIILMGLKIINLLYQGNEITP